MPGPSLSKSSRRSGGRGTAVGSLLQLGWLLQGCLPVDDLSSYSSAWGQMRDVASNLPLDAAPPGDARDGGASDAELDASAPFVPGSGDGGGEADAGESPAGGDAGASDEPDAGLVPVDAGN